MEEKNYEQAMNELEEIVKKMETDRLPVDDLTNQLAKAQRLIKLCRDKLTKTEEEIKRIIDDDK